VENLWRTCGKLTLRGADSACFSGCNDPDYSSPETVTHGFCWAFFGTIRAILKLKQEEKVEIGKVEIKREEIFFCGESGLTGGEAPPRPPP